MKITWKLLVERFTSPTPAFWRKVRKRLLQFAGSCGTLGGGLLTVDGLPEWLNITASYLVQIGFVGPLIIAFVVSFTCEDKPSGNDSNV